MIDLYIPIESSIINKPQEQVLRGVEVFSSLPPFFVPHGLRVREGEDVETLTIEFEYDSLKTESLQSIELAHGISVLTGKKSGRIVRIDLSIPLLEKIHTETPDKYEFVKRLENIIESSSTEISSPNSYSVTRSVFENYGDKVFASRI